MSPRHPRARVDPGPAPVTIAEQKLLVADAHLAATRTQQIQDHVGPMLLSTREIERRVVSIEQTAGQLLRAAEGRMRAMEGELDSLWWSIAISAGVLIVLTLVVVRIAREG